MKDVWFPLQFYQKEFWCWIVVYWHRQSYLWNKIFDETRKKVIGKMKDEFGGVIVNEFVGLKSKMHSMKKIEKNVIQQKEWVSQLSLTNLTTFYLMRKLLDEKLKEFKVKSINSNIWN